MTDFIPVQHWVKEKKMNRFKRVICIVMDSVGAGEAADAAKFGDIGSDTLGNIARHEGGLNLPNLAKLGLGNTHNILGVDPVEKPLGYHHKLSEASNGKDTMTGHWEMMGLHIEKPFITFTETGFPKELMDELSKRTGHKLIGNKSASGTEIIEELGEQQIKEDALIVYTSADSVLQIAANEDLLGIDNLYKYCEIARELTMKDEWKVGRVIARPYVGLKKGEFKRTSNRHDYALKPFAKTALNSLEEGGYEVISVGKIVDIFDNYGVTEAHRSKSNKEGMEITIDLVKNKDFSGFIFTNLVDFDSLWGHRRNPKGYKDELELFDRQLGELLPLIKEDDLLIITADHGNDPTFTGSDHTREQVPGLYYSPSLKGYGLLDESNTFADIGQTVVDNFNTEPVANGKSLLNQLV